MTGRPADTVARVEAYAKEQGLFRTDASPEPRFNESLSLDLGSVVPSVAGPRRPQDRVALSDLVENFRGTFAAGLHTHDDGSTHDHAEPAAAVETVVDEASEESFPASDPPSYTQRTEADAGPEPGQPAPPAPAPHTNHGDTHYRAVDGGPGRRAGQAALRLGGDRRHHLLHQHQQPQRDGRGRAAGPERRGARPADAGLGQDLAGARLPGGDRLPGRRRSDGPAAGARLRPGRLRLHHLHRQLRTAGRADRGGDRRERPGRRGGPVRQPQLRGAHSSAGARQLPGLAAAGGGVCPGRAASTST